MALIETVDALRVQNGSRLDTERKSDLGQFMSPAPVARLMASMIGTRRPHLRLLEPGAGVGSLVAAAVEALCGRGEPPERISVTAYEIEATLLSGLQHTLSLCAEACTRAGIAFDSEIIQEDFIHHAVEALDGALFSDSARLVHDLVITNPPYRKINSSSTHRKLLRRVGIETSNLYAAFLALSIQLLDQGGELVAITPRSFCNGPYFRPFRELLLSETGIQRVHIFESRKEAFREDDVLQENIIFRAVRGVPTSEVAITTGSGDPEGARIIQYDQLVWPGDPQRFIHIAPDDEEQHITDAMRGFRCGLGDLGLSVSTGRVVDFRVKDQICTDPEEGAAPLIYPSHFDGGAVQWPKAGKKPNALRVDDYTRPQLVPDGHYVLVKRFSSKEEKRRIVAVVYEGDRIPVSEGVGFENHLNYFHQEGQGLDLSLARGLSIFLNSTLVDKFFRQFSGHTQVNATDLRTLAYPSREQLHRLGSQVGSTFPAQEEIDELVQGVVPTARKNGRPRVEAKRRGAPDPPGARVAAAAAK